MITKVESPAPFEDEPTFPRDGNPWVNPPRVTPEMHLLAEAWDAGGHDLIHEVEYEPPRAMLSWSAVDVALRLEELGRRS